MMPKEQIAKVLARAKEILQEAQDAHRLGRADGREWLADVVIAISSELYDAREKVLEIEEENQQLRAELARLARTVAQGQARS